MEDRKITNAEDISRREEFIDMVCEESGLNREFVESEMDYAKQHGIKYKVYAVKGYWNIPHDVLVETHRNGGRRRKIAREMAERRGIDRHSMEKKLIDARFNQGLTVGYFMKYDWDLLTDEQKEQMLLRPASAAMSRKYRTEDADSDLMNNKERFYQLFPECIGRRWIHYDPLMTLDEFENSIQPFETLDVIYKPFVSSGGKGIRKLSLKEGTKHLYEELKEAGQDQALVEEALQQHKDMARLCKDSINTIRMVTLCWNGQYHLLYAVCRIGPGNGSITDNVSQGGLVIGVDTKAGVFNTAAADRDGKPQRVHPASGTRLVGFQIPYWEETLEMIEMAAKRIHDRAGLGYAGWDVAITPMRPVLVEGNNWPDASLIQICHWVEEKKGMKYLFEPYL